MRHRCGYTHWKGISFGLLCTLLPLLSMADSALPASSSSLSISVSVPTSVAVVNIPYLLERSPQTLAAQQKLKARFAASDAEIQSAGQEIQSLQESLTQEAANLTEKQLLERQRDLRSEKRNHQRRVEDYREELRNARDSATHEVQSIVFAAIDQVREREKIDIVFKESDYISASKRVDISEKVLQYLRIQFNESLEKSMTADDPKE